jgi:ketosteroid isomerase-like protein
MTDDAGAFLRDWFGRLAETGWTAEVFLAALAENLTWTATGTSPISGTYRGRDAYIDGVYRRLDERLASWPRPHVERIIADGEWGMVEFSSTGGLGKNGTGYDMRYCWVIHVVDDRVVEVVGYYDTQKVTALFT